MNMADMAYIATIVDRNTGEVLAESDPLEYYEALRWAEDERAHSPGRLSLRPFRRKVT